MRVEFSQICVWLQKKNTENVTLTANNRAPNIKFHETYGRRLLGTVSRN